MKVRIKPHAHRRLGKHVDQCETHDRGVFAVQRAAAAAELMRGAPLSVGFLPARRFGNVAQDPESDERRQHTDQIHVTPCARPGRADQDPDGGSKDASDRIAGLQKRSALAARIVGPQLGRDRGAGRPFGADGETDQEAENGKRQPTPRQRAQAGEQGIGENGQGHRALAADVVGQNAAEQTTSAPAEHRDGDHCARIGGNELVL